MLRGRFSALARAAGLTPAQRRETDRKAVKETPPHGPEGFDAVGMTVVIPS